MSISEVSPRAAGRGRVESVSHKGETLCLIIRAEPSPEVTTFYTPNDFNLQVGKIVYRAGSEIPRHTHLPITRTVERTSEVVIVQKGRALLDVYSDDRALVSSHEMRPGDAVVLIAGGHGFRVLEDTILLEVKQGPYTGLQEKERF